MKPKQQSAPSLIVNPSESGWKLLIYGLSALSVAVFFMSYFNLFTVVQILRDLENKNLPSSQNLNMMIDVFGGMIGNWHWLAGGLLFVLSAHGLIVPKSYRQHARQVLGSILIVVSLVAIIWVLVTMFFVPN